MAVDYERKIWKKVRELVDKNSKKHLELSNVETYQALWFTRTPMLLEPKEISGTRKPSIDYAY